MSVCIGSCLTQKAINGHRGAFVASKDRYGHMLLLQPKETVTGFRFNQKTVTGFRCNQKKVTQSLSRYMYRAETTHIETTPLVRIPRMRLFLSPAVLPLHPVHVPHVTPRPDHYCRYTRYMYRTHRHVQTTAQYRYRV